MWRRQIWISQVRISVGLQGLVLVLWLGYVTNGFQFNPPIDTKLLGIGFCFIAIGQVLNVAVFDAIGYIGVYYGTKLDYTVVWHDGFPFNVVSHPQYVGSVLTVWGLLLDAKSIFPIVPWKSIVILGSFWTMLYFITGSVEQYL